MSPATRPSSGRFCSRMTRENKGKLMIFPPELELQSEQLIHPCELSKWIESISCRHWGQQAAQQFRISRHRWTSFPERLRAADADYANLSPEFANFFVYSQSR